MTNQTITMSRELAENLLHCGVTISFITPSMTAELRKILAAPVVERQCVATVQSMGFGRKYAAMTFDQEQLCSVGDALYTSPPSPVAVLKDHEFRELVELLKSSSELFWAIEDDLGAISASAVGVMRIKIDVALAEHVPPAGGEPEALHLNSCASCGGRFGQLKTSSNALLALGYYVKCESCEAKTSGYDKAVSAVEEWNGEAPQ